MLFYYLLAVAHSQRGRENNTIRWRHEHNWLATPALLKWKLGTSGKWVQPSGACTSLNKPPPEWQQSSLIFLTTFFNHHSPFPPSSSQYLSSSLYLYGPLYLTLSDMTLSKNHHIWPFTANGALSPSGRALLPPWPPLPRPPTSLPSPGRRIRGGLRQLCNQVIVKPQYWQLTVKCEYAYTVSTAPN